MAKELNSKQGKRNIHIMAVMLKAVAHPDRLAILQLLFRSPDERLVVKEIYEKLHLQQPVVSRHLNILKNAGVIRRLPKGQKIYYCLCSEKKTIESLSRCL